MGISQASIAKVRRAIEFTFDFLASDSIACVPFSGSPKTIRAMVQDFESGGMGVIVDAAGRRVHYDLEVVISADDLLTAGLTIATISHFLFGGKRYDLSTGENVLSKMVPIGGVHNLITIYLTKAVELDQTVTPNSIGYVE